MKKSVGGSMAAACRGSIFVPLMWPHSQGEVITTLLVNGTHAWMVMEGAGLINEQHTFQSQLIQTADPNVESRLLINVFAGGCVTHPNHSNVLQSHIPLAALNRR